MGTHPIFGKMGTHPIFCIPLLERDTKVSKIYCGINATATNQVNPQALLYATRYI